MAPEYTFAQLSKDLSRVNKAMAEAGYRKTYLVQAEVEVWDNFGITGFEFLPGKDRLYPVGIDVSNIDVEMRYLFKREDESDPRTYAFKRWQFDEAFPELYGKINDVIHERPLRILTELTWTHMHGKPALIHSCISHLASETRYHLIRRQALMEEEKEDKVHSLQDWGMF